MNGQTICRLDEGSARCTSSPPRSTARGTIRVSMASTVDGTPRVGSGQGLQLMMAFLFSGSDRHGGGASSARWGWDNAREWTILRCAPSPHRLTADVVAP